VSGDGQPLVIGRYALYDEIARGGMATVHYGRLLGPVGFARTVAIKRLHPHYARDPEFVSMFLDEARLAARVHHPNVVSTLDVVAESGELFLVMEYVPGASLASILSATIARKKRIRPEFAGAILVGALQGLHAAHEARSEQGLQLNIVHRDVSPQNVLVGVDGIARVLDFGIAKAADRTHHTREGHLKGKLPYMAPEQTRGKVSRATDIYAAGVVLWEALTGRRLFFGKNDAEVLGKVLAGQIDPPNLHASDVPVELVAATLRALDANPEKRFSTAREMAQAIQGSVPLVATSDIGDWVQELLGDELAGRAGTVARIEGNSGDQPVLRKPLVSAPDTEETRADPPPDDTTTAFRHRSETTVLTDGALSLGTHTYLVNRRWVFAGVAATCVVSLCAGFLIATSWRHAQTRSLAISAQVVAASAELPLSGPAVVDAVLEPPPPPPPPAAPGSVAGPAQTSHVARPPPRPVPPKSPAPPKGDKYGI
jgi:serine/threonine-protein kinase